MKGTRMGPALAILVLIFTALSLSGMRGSAAPLMTPVMVRGFQTPESVLHDPLDDVYLVSNINGNPTGTDGNGFISRLKPNGTVIALKWIDGMTTGVKLNAPKGLAVAGNTLYVTDITTVRMFDRRTGRFKGSLAIPGSTFLNDAAAGPDGSIYITDSGLKPDFSPSGTDAVYRISPRGVLKVVTKGPQLKAPNGVAVLPNGQLIVVTFAPGGLIYNLTRSGRMENARRLPKGQLDGVEALPGGALLVSSWEASAVFRIARDGKVTVVAKNVKAPADIGYDRRRDRLLIPLFMNNQVVIQPLK